MASVASTYRSKGVSSAASKITVSKTSSSKIPVRFKKSGIPVRTKGTLFCRHHPNKEVTLVCEDCDGELVCVDCVTSVHQRHGLIKLSDIAPLKKDQLQAYVNKAENSALPKVKKYLKSASEKLAENKSVFQDLANKIVNQGDAMKKEIDKITDKLVASCKETEEFNNKKLIKYRKSLTALFADLNLQIHECKQLLKSGTTQQLYIAEKKVTKGMKMPSAPVTRTMFFSPSSMSLDQLEQSIGILTSPEEEDSDSEDKTYSSTVKEFDSASGVFQTEDVSGVLTMPQHLSHSIGMVGEFKHKTDIHSLCATFMNQLWILDIFSYDVVLVNKQGTIKDSLDIKVSPDDLSISPVNGHMWLSTEDDYKIREFVIGSKEPPRVRFHSTDLPLCLCVTRENTIMVGTHKTVTIFKPDGDVIHRTTTDRTRRQLVTVPRHIAQCALTGNVAVADADDPEWGGDDVPHVVVMDSNLVLKFRYRGETQTSATGKKRSNTLNFDPYDMCFDSNGSILIADRTTRSVTLISIDGRHIGTVLVDKERPVALALYNDILWVGFDRGKVKVLKYICN